MTAHFALRIVTDTRECPYCYCACHFGFVRCSKYSRTDVRSVFCAPPKPNCLPSRRNPNTRAAPEKQSPGRQAGRGINPSAGCSAPGPWMAQHPAGVEAESNLLRSCRVLVGQGWPISTKIWSGKPGSNWRPQPWQGCALPTELFPLVVLATRLLPRARRRLKTSFQSAPLRPIGLRVGPSMAREGFGGSVSRYALVS